MKINVIVPVYNEENNIEIFYNEIKKIKDNYNYDLDIIFVNDGSRDKTKQKIELINKKDNSVKLISLLKNKGSHLAILAGLKYASAEVNVIMSVDLQDPPELIIEFIKKIKQGIPIVWGVRKKREDNLLRKIYAAFYYKFIRAFIFKNYPITGTGSFCAFNKDVLKTLKNISEKNTVVFGLLMWTGYKYDFVYYDRKKRLHGTSKWTLFKMIKSAVDLTISFSYFPVRFISSIGIVFSMIGFISAVFLILQALLTGNIGKGWYSIIVLLLVTGGIIIFMLGIIGEYLCRILDEVRKMPAYVIEDTKGFNN